MLIPHNHGPVDSHKVPPTKYLIEAAARNFEVVRRCWTFHRLWHSPLCPHNSVLLPNCLLEHGLTHVFDLFELESPSQASWWLHQMQCQQSVVNGPTQTRIGHPLAAKQVGTGASASTVAQDSCSLRLQPIATLGRHCRIGNADSRCPRWHAPFVQRWPKIRRRFARGTLICAAPS